jgi:hypothetical protein
VLLADGARESWGAVASAMLLRASRIAAAIEVVIAVVVAVAIEIMDQVVAAVAIESLMVITVVVLTLAWARSVRGASGVVVFPVSGFLV